MNELKTLFHGEALNYTGPELTPHYILRTFDLRGSAVVAFRGACHVATEHLVDWEDRLEKDHIRAKEMVHFLGEFFGVPLPQAVYFQRLFMALLAETLNEKLGSGGNRVSRRGDDLFWAGRKLSVSIVTASPVSCLLHVGINVDPEGAPVPAVGVAEMGLLPEQWVEEFLGRIQQEWSGISWACAKVRPVM